MRNIVKPDFKVSDIVISLLVLTLYFISFAYFLSAIRQLPTSVNFVFVSRSWKYVLILLTAVSLIYRLFFYRQRDNNTGSTYKNSIAKVAIGDFLLLLLPATPVIQYIINNQDILTPIDSLYVLSIFVLLSAFYVLVIPMLFGYVRSARIWSFLGLAFVHTLTSMAMLSNHFNWFEEGSLKIQWLFFWSVFLIIWILSNLNDQRVLRLLIVTIFVVNTISQVFSVGAKRMSEGSAPGADNRLLSLVDGKAPVETPNIYLLVYDAYVSNETMLGYGIDNSSHEEYLKNTGFVLYPQTYSVGSYSAGTMSRVLNASTDFYGNVRRGASGDGIVQDTLRNFGYETYGIFSSDYFFQGIGSTYDVSFPDVNPPVNILINGIFMGEFRFDQEFSKTSSADFIETKQHVFERGSANQMFVYMHTSFPGHSQNSGACLPDETEQFAVRLDRANIEMQQDIQTITKNDPAGIIIVAGDHGPYLTKNCLITEGEYDISEISRLDIQDRYGTFLAIRWPTKDFTEYDEITVLQDLFPAVFAYLFQDTGILQAKVEPLTLEAHRISGVTVENNIIHGGINDGEPLFVTER